MEILQTLDKLGMYSTERAEGKTPFFMLDRHGYCLELSFLKYINEKDTGHEWVCCIGVPYGTSVWPVGDSSEQNGYYKMAYVSFKRKSMAEIKDE